MNEGALAHPAGRPSSCGSSEQLDASRAPRGLTSWTGLAQKLLQPAFSVIVRSDGGACGRGSVVGVFSTRARPTTARSRRQAAMGAEGSLEAPSICAVLLTEKETICNSRAPQLGLWKM